MAKPDWTTCTSMDELLSRHSAQLSRIENGLFLQHPGVFRSLQEMLANCRACVLDEDLCLFLNDALNLVASDDGEPLFAWDFALPAN
ncbi:hypothetical protein HDU91_004903 [Kappamyces sp. JEL0680]|nr:hypothetical protein HDU91_004903 [Kappamyces sp. JEL0680]